MAIVTIDNRHPSFFPNLVLLSVSLSLFLSPSLSTAIYTMCLFGMFVSRICSSCPSISVGNIYIILILNTWDRFLYL